MDYGRAEPDNLPWMQNPELARRCKRQEGAALMRQGMDASPIQSPWQGVSRLAQALLGGMRRAKGDEEITDTAEKRRKMAAELMAPYQRRGRTTPNGSAGWRIGWGGCTSSARRRAAYGASDLASLINDAATQRGIPPQLATSLWLGTEKQLQSHGPQPQSGAFGIGRCNPDATPIGRPLRRCSADADWRTDPGKVGAVRWT